MSRAALVDGEDATVWSGATIPVVHFFRPSPSCGVPGRAGTGPRPADQVSAKTSSKGQKKKKKKKERRKEENCFRPLAASRRYASEPVSQATGANRVHRSFSACKNRLAMRRADRGQWVRRGARSPRPRVGPTRPIKRGQGNRPAGPLPPWPPAPPETAAQHHNRDLASSAPLQPRCSTVSVRSRRSPGKRAAPAAQRGNQVFALSPSGLSRSRGPVARPESFAQGGGVGPALGSPVNGRGEQLARWLVHYLLDAVHGPRLF